MGQLGLPALGVLGACGVNGHGQSIQGDLIEEILNTTLASVEVREVLLGILNQWLTSYLRHETTRERCREISQPRLFET